LATLIPVSETFSPASIIGTNDAERVGDFTLMAGTGTPGGQPEAPNCTNPNGCPDNRVLLVDRAGDIVWQYGEFGVAGSGPDQLNVPVQNTWLPNRHVLITDQANERVMEVDVATKVIVWQYGTTGVSGNGPDQLNNPNCALLLENGHILICDENLPVTVQAVTCREERDRYPHAPSVSGMATP